MKKENLLTRDEMKKVVGGNAPIIGCTMMCTVPDGPGSVHNGYSILVNVEDCSLNTQTDTCMGGTASDCDCYGVHGPM